MRRETHGELSERIFALIDGKTTDLAPEVYLNPVEGYTSPEKLEQEMRTLFRQYPADGHVLPHPRAGRLFHG